MRGTKAKAIRRHIYGDMSLKIRRAFIVQNGGLTNHPVSPRSMYLKLKRSLRWR